jgi:hypothetical protein
MRGIASLAVIARSASDAAIHRGAQRQSIVTSLPQTFCNLTALALLSAPVTFLKSNQIK